MNSKQLVKKLKGHYPQNFDEHQGESLMELIQSEKLTEFEIERFYKSIIENYSSEYKSFPDYSFLKQMLVNNRHRYKEYKRPFGVFDPLQFRNLSAEEILDILKKLAEKDRKRLRAQTYEEETRYKFTNAEMDFWIYFEKIWSEFGYMINDLNWPIEKVMTRIKQILSYTFTGTKYKSIFDVIKNKRQEEKAECIIEKCMDSLKLKEQSILPANPDYFND